jgi:hypothetical protein
MSFFLERGGTNLPLEVQRWQYFLRKQRIPEAGIIDGQFGLITETATKTFQAQHNVGRTGKLDAVTLGAAVAQRYTDRPSDYYEDKHTANFPARPPHLQSPTSAGRNRGLGCFRFVQLPLVNRADPDGIHMLGSCDGAIIDWEQSQIIDLPVPQLAFVTGFHGRFSCHRLVAPHVQRLFQRWEELDLLHLLLVYDGSFNPRYMRGASPGTGAQPEKRSDQAEGLSNHAFGSAFDINAKDNPFKQQPALCPARGAVRELVSPANDLGFYWGGHFSSRLDGMHFEFADFAHL